jgi:phage I-like protein
MKNNCIILNRAWQQPADGWQHLMPFGEFPGRLLDGTPIVQVLDQQAAANIAAAFEASRVQEKENFRGVLVDLEHKSMEPNGDTTAAAYVTALANRADGLYGQMALSDLGATVINGGRIRSLSPVFALVAVAPDSKPPRFRPTRLLSAGLTNKPNLAGMKPLTTFTGVACNSEHFYLETKADEARKASSMKEIMKALGLAEDASEADAVVAINSIKTTAAELPVVKNRLQEIEAAALATEADAFVAANKDRIQDAVAMKKLYVANKTFATELIATLKPVETAAAVALNKAEAGNPGKKGTCKNKLEEFRSMKEGKEKDEFQTANAAELIRLEKDEKAAANKG